MSFSKTGVTRRRALAGAATLGTATLGAATLPLPFIGRAKAAGPIRIGLLLAKTGDIAAQTEYLANGTYLALEERGNKIMGQPAELVWLDEPSPQGAQQNMQKLVQENKVVRDPRRLAELQRAGRAGDRGAAEDPVRLQQCRGDRDHRQELQPLHVPAEHAGRRAGAHVRAVHHGLRQEVVFPHRSLRVRPGHRQVVHTSSWRRPAAPMVGDDEVPLNTPDYSSFILKIRQAKPDMVLGGVPAGDLSTFLKQWNEMGMKGKIPICEIAIGDTDIWAVGPQAATGLYTSLWWYNNPNNPPDEKKLAADLPEEVRQAGGGQGVDGLDHREVAVRVDRAAKSTEPMAIIEALENWKGGTPEQPVQLSQGRPPDAAAEPGGRR